MITVALNPDSHEGKCEAFVDKNYRQLSELYPGKWIVVINCKVLFTADSSDEMFDKAESLGMERGKYYYRHIPKSEKVIRTTCFLGV